MTTKLPVDDLRIRQILEVAPPSHVVREFPISERAAQTTVQGRRAIHRILEKEDDRLVVVMGPCSIHDPQAARDYAKKLAEARHRYAQTLEIIMRVYFEKPRTTVGWKGLINDPDLDNRFNINKGLRLARELLVDINEAGLPAATEFLDVITPQYFADLISWGAIGARTTESQVHRELASGLSCAVGFKNGTDGNVSIAIDAIRATAQPHHFLSVTKAGHSAIVSTTGNQDSHLILRGGKVPNYDKKSVADVAQKAADVGIRCRIMIDASHGNSQKDHKRQMDVVQAVAEQISDGNLDIIGVMVESHLKEGRQDLKPGVDLTYGQSITDACLGWDDSLRVLDILSDGVIARRSAV